MTKKLELLAPAKNLEQGVAAINHGADAVYIGAPLFGARIAAGNSLNDIEELVKHAHLFHSKVFATVNTLLFDNELEEARKLMWQLYNAGVDAVIVQDLGLLELDIPPSNSMPRHKPTTSTFNAPNSWNRRGLNALSLPGRHHWNRCQYCGKKPPSISRHSFRAHYASAIADNAT